MKWVTGRSGAGIVGLLGAPLSRPASAAVVIVLVGAFSSSYLASLGISIALACISAMSLAVLMGWAGQVSLLVAPLLLVGGYCASAVGSANSMSLLLGVLAALAAGAVLGSIASLAALRMTGMYLVVATVAVLFIVNDAGNYVESASGHTGGYVVNPPRLFGAQLLGERPWFWVSAICAFAVYLYYLRLSHSRLGRAWRLIREDRFAASVAGVPVGRYILLAFALTSGVTAAAGALATYYQGSVSFSSFGLDLAVSYVVMVVIGGNSSLGGAIFGAIVITQLPNVLQDVLGTGNGIGTLAEDMPYIDQLIYGVLGLVVLVAVDRLRGKGFSRLGRIAALAGQVAGGRVRAPRPLAPGAPARRPSHASKGDRLVVRISDLHVQYGRGEEALSGLTLDVEEGGALGVLGRNGAGKSTFLYTLAGFPQGSGGRIIRGEISLTPKGETSSLAHRSTARRVRAGVLLVPAEDKIFPGLSVWEHLRQAVGRASRREARRRVDELLKLEGFAGLADRLGARAGVLSGGQRQLLALACGLLQNPKLLLVNEASLGLSPTAVASVGDTLASIRGSLARTLIVVDQNPQMVAMVSENISVMDAGRIVESNIAHDSVVASMARLYLGSASGVSAADPDSPRAAEPALPPRPAVAESARAVTAPRSAPQARAVAPAGFRVTENPSEPWDGKPDGQPAVALSHASLVLGGMHILRDVSLTAEFGSRVGLIGPNGAGKTSVANLICAYYRATDGEVLVHGQNVSGLHPYQVTRLGIRRSFQSVGHVRDLRVVDYVSLGFEPEWPSGAAQSVLGGRRARRNEREARETSHARLEQAGLGDYADKLMADCPYGVRKTVNIVRTAASGGDVLIFDEPTSGVSEDDRSRIAGLLSGISQGNVEHDGRHEQPAVIVIDHDVRFVRALCTHLVAMDAGKVIRTGSLESVLEDPLVISTFLGTSSRPA